MTTKHCSQSSANEVPGFIWPKLVVEVRVQSQKAIHCVFRLPPPRGL